nr:hypothetical protein [Streptomyces sp. DSM 41633]
MKIKLTTGAVAVLDSKPGLWYQNAVRVFAVAAALLVCTAACGPRPAPEPTPTSSGPQTTGNVVTVSPARIDRVRQDLPP